MLRSNQEIKKNLPKMVSSIRMHNNLHEISFKHWKFCYCSCPEVSLSGLGLASDAELISLVEQQDTWTWGNTVVWLPGHIHFRPSQLWSDWDYLICQKIQQIVWWIREECHQASVSLILVRLCTSVLHGFSVLFFCFLI